MDCDGIQPQNGVRARPGEGVSRADKAAVRSGISDDE